MDILKFTTALAKAKNQPDLTYESLWQAADELIGARLFTLTEIDMSRQEARRIYTNMPDAYPVKGTKPVEESPWTQKVIHQQEIFIANTIDDIAEVFFDYELIQSLGCEAVINIPIVVAGKVLGTINCLHDAHHYTPERLALSENLKTLGAVAFLLVKPEAS